jgi:cytochrome b
MSTKVWTSSIRIFHWLLAIGFTAAYILSDFDEYQNLHYAFGLFVGVLISFRIVYGFIGNKYANFKDFPISVKNQLTFLKSFFDKDKTYVGHNPAASIVMLGIFIVGLISSLSGYLLYSAENPTFVKTNLGEELIGEVHEVFGNLFLILVITHLIGILTDLLFHSKTKTIQSIFTGYKTVDGENSKQTTLHQFFTIIWFVVPFLAFMYGKGLTTKTTSEKEQIEHHENTQEEDEHTEIKD